MADILKISFNDDVKELSYDFEKEELCLRVRFSVNDKSVIGQEDLLNALKEVAEICLKQIEGKRGTPNA